MNLRDATLAAPRKSCGTSPASDRTRAACRRHTRTSAAPRRPQARPIEAARPSGRREPAVPRGAGTGTMSPARMSCLRIRPMVPALGAFRPLHSRRTAAGDPGLAPHRLVLADLLGRADQALRPVGPPQAQGPSVTGARDGSASSGRPSRRAWISARRPPRRPCPPRGLRALPRATGPGRPFGTPPRHRLRRPPRAPQRTWRLRTAPSTRILASRVSFLFAQHEQVGRPAPLRQSPSNRAGPRPIGWRGQSSMCLNSGTWSTLPVSGLTGRNGE